MEPTGFYHFDAALGRKQEAIQEAKRAVEMLLFLKMRTTVPLLCIT